MRCSTYLLLIVMLLSLLLAGCATSPYSSRAGMPIPEEQALVDEALAGFQARSELQTFFDQSYAIAVFPRVLRAGLGGGAAYGRGVVRIGEDTIGRTWVYQFNVGINVGIQRYAQIIFFRNQEVLELFQQSNFEFGGQAGAAVGSAGANSTGAYHPDMAVFNLNDVGLLIEASVGAHRYEYRDLILTNTEQTKLP